MKTLYVKDARGQGVKAQLDSEGRLLLCTETHNDLMPHKTILAVYVGSVMHISPKVLVDYMTVPSDTAREGLYERLKTMMLLVATKYGVDYAWTERFDITPDPYARLWPDGTALGAHPDAEAALAAEYDRRQYVRWLR